MPCLAAIVLAAFFYVHSQFDIKGVPMPVVIETGRSYNYDLIYSSITVPDNWVGDCYGQRMVVKYMEMYYNGQLNGNQKHSEEWLKQVENKWECVN